MERLACHRRLTKLFDVPAHYHRTRVCQRPPENRYRKSEHTEPSARGKEQVGELDGRNENGASHKCLWELFATGWRHCKSKIARNRNGRSSEPKLYEFGEFATKPKAIDMLHPIKDCARSKTRCKSPKMRHPIHIWYARPKCDIGSNGN